MALVTKVAAEPRFLDIILPSRQYGVKEGVPAITFSTNDYQAITMQLEFTLIAKFQMGRPTLDEIKKFMLDNCGLEGRVTINSNWDDHHVVIILDSEVMLFRWEADYNPKKEGTRITKWIRLPGLPMEFFVPACLKAIVSSFASYLGIDEKTKERSALNYARVCVELDVRKALPARVWINLLGNKGKGSKSGQIAAKDKEGNNGTCINSMQGGISRGHDRTKGDSEGWIEVGRRRNQKHHGGSQPPSAPANMTEGAVMAGLTGVLNPIKEVLKKEGDATGDVEIGGDEDNRPTRDKEDARVGGHGEGGMAAAPRGSEENIQPLAAAGEIELKEANTKKVAREVKVPPKSILTRASAKAKQGGEAEGSRNNTLHGDTEGLTTPIGPHVDVVIILKPKVNHDRLQGLAVDVDNDAGVREGLWTELLDMAEVHANKPWLVVGYSSPSPVTDHCPLLEIEGCKVQAARFHYQVVWESHPDFKELVHTTWEGGLSTNPLVNIGLKLKKLCYQLWEWNWKVFGDLNTRAREATLQVAVLEGRLQSDGWDADVHGRLVQYRQLHGDITDHLLSIQRDKARLSWLKDGDRNSKLFHAARRLRRMQNHFQLDIGEEEPTSDGEVIGGKAVAFYQELFGGYSPPASVDHFGMFGSLKRPGAGWVH
ncbi:hypothetical protein QQ045_027594 [Rhodiola kirilowii]